MVWLTVLRPEEGRRRVHARLASMPATVEADRVAAEYGFMIRDPEAQPQRGAPPPTAVPSVAAVLPGSRAARAGLQVGDVVVEVSGRHVVTVQAVREALLAAGPDGPLPLVVRRERERVFLRLEAAGLP
jgi:S1-C subfamily serine protease